MYLARLGWEVTVVTPHSYVWRHVEDSEKVSIELDAQGIHRIPTDHQWRCLVPQHLNCWDQGLGWVAGGVCRTIARRLGVDTQHETVVFMHKDCPVCRSEGFTAHNRVLLRAGDRHIIATLYQVTTDLLSLDEAALSEPAWVRLGLRGGETIAVSHPDPVDSLSHVRGRIYGNEFTDSALKAIVTEHWIDADDVRVRSEEPDLSHWWTVFNDPMLDDLVQTAYRQNLTLREAGFREVAYRNLTGGIVAIHSATK